jgi:hypothetical protein
LRGFCIIGSNPGYIELEFHMISKTKVDVARAAIAFVLIEPPAEEPDHRHQAGADASPTFTPNFSEAEQCFRPDITGSLGMDDFHRYKFTCH